MVALTIAHNLPAAPVAKEAHEIVESLAGRGDELVGQQLAADLIYHTAFGSLQKGIDAGRSLMDLTKHGKSFTRFLWALRAAAMPLLYSGDFSGARRLLAEARGLAIECCLFDAAMSATENDRQELFKRATAKPRKIGLPPIVKYQPRPRDCTVSLSLTRHKHRSICSRTGRAAPQYAATMNAPVRPNVPEIRFRSAAYAIIAVSRLAVGQEFHQSQEFNAAFRRASESGGQDVAAYAMWALRSRSGEADSAAKLLRHYIESQRREQSPLPKFLSSALC